MLNHGNGFHIQKINEKFKEKQGAMLLLFFASQGNGAMLEGGFCFCCFL